MRSITDISWLREKITQIKIKNAYTWYFFQAAKANRSKNLFFTDFTRKFQQKNAAAAEGRFHS